MPAEGKFSTLMPWRKGFLLRRLMIIKINGKSEEVKMHSNIAELILGKSLCPDNLVLELNYRIVPRQDWQNVVLKENDTIEIISFVGGG